MPTEPGLKMLPGMMPILHSPAVITPATTEHIAYAVNGNVVTATPDKGYVLGAADGWTIDPETGIGTYTADIVSVSAGATNSARIAGSRQTTWIPVRASARSDVACGAAAIVSVLRMRAMSSAEATNVAASAAIAIGAVSQATSAPPSAGPVISAISFKDPDELIKRANATTFGLGSGVWTTNVSKAHQVAKALRAGSVWVNCYQAMDPAVPFGGYKMSGHGRESGKQHVEEYLNVKAVWIKTA